MTITMEAPTIPINDIKPGVLVQPQEPASNDVVSTEESMYPDRVILTTYQGQSGIKPIPLQWGAPTAKERGPVLSSRHPDSIKRRNAVGYALLLPERSECMLADRGTVRMPARTRSTER